jgi:hypothetical protein
VPGACVDDVVVDRLGQQAQRGDRPSEIVADSGHHVAARSLRVGQAPEGAAPEQPGGPAADAQAIAGEQNGEQRVVP